MTIKLIDIFEELCRDIRFDKKLASEFYKYQIGFVNKNEEHVLFFGGNLLGVQVLRFTDSDYNTLFDDILNVDPNVLKEMIKEDPNINQNFVVSSDEFNLTCFYAAHKFLTSKYLDDKTRLRAAKDVMLIYQYRIMSSLLYHYFRYPADPDIAQATYANLSNRFLIKKLGSWQELFNYRADEIVREDGLHKHVLSKFDNDGDIVNMVNDTQGRIRDIVKNIYAEFKKVHVSGERIDVSSSTEITLDGKDVIRDKIHGPDIYSKYILSLIADEHTFIKEELFSIVVQAMPGVNIRMFRSMLEWMSIESHSHHGKDIEKFIHQVLLYTIEYLYTDGSILKQTRDLVALTINIRNLYLASRSSDMELQEIRDLGTKIIKHSMPSIGSAMVSSVRTSIILYIALRAFTKHYYHG